MRSCIWTLEMKMKHWNKNKTYSSWILIMKSKTLPMLLIKINQLLRVVLVNSLKKFLKKIAVQLKNKKKNKPAKLLGILLEAYPPTSLFYFSRQLPWRKKYQLTFLKMSFKLSKKKNLCHSIALECFCCL